MSGELQCCHHRAVQRQGGTTPRLPQTPPPLPQEAAAPLQNLHRQPGGQEQVQPRHAHERRLHRGPGRLPLGLLHLPRRGPAARGRPQHLQLPRPASPHVGGGGQVQVQTPLQDNIWRSGGHQDGAVQETERVLKPVLGVGRRGRRHVQEDSLQETQDRAVQARDSEVHHDQTQAAAGQQGAGQDTEDLEQEVPHRRPQHSQVPAGGEEAPDAVHQRLRPAGAHGVLAEI